MPTARETLSAWAAHRHPDATLFDSALRGDPVAFSEVYRRYHTRVFAFCMARLMSAEAASDATQEVFLRLLSAHPDSVESPSSWLFGVARHVCIDIDRRQHRTLPAENLTIEAELDGAGATASAEDQAVSRDDAAAVFLALRRLRPRYRTVLVMRELHGQPVAEIAEALGTNVGAAYTLLSRARDAFGAAYAEAAQLPAECRRSVELIYRRSGSGISAGEVEGLEAHLSRCRACAREAQRAESRSMLGALPLLLGGAASRHTFVSRALQALGPDAPALAGTAPVAASAAERWGTLAWASIGIASASVLLATAVIVPIHNAESTATKSGSLGDTAPKTVATSVTDQSFADDPGQEAVLRRRLDRELRSASGGGSAPGAAAAGPTDTRQRSTASAQPKYGSGGGGSTSGGAGSTAIGTPSGAKGSGSPSSGGGAGTSGASVSSPAKSSEVAGSVQNRTGQGSGTGASTATRSAGTKP